jgi:hypothetical protein
MSASGPKRQLPRRTMMSESGSLADMASFKNHQPVRESPAPT